MISTDPFTARLLGLVALCVGVMALALAASPWFSEIGAGMGVLSFVIAVMSITTARRLRRRSWAGIVAIPPSLVAIGLFPFYLWACSSWLECV